MNANQTQIGGDHYKAELQHWDFVNICLSGRYMEGQVTKYITRWRKKNGKEDLQKAKHYLTKLIELYTAGNIKPPRPVALPALRGTLASEFRKFTESNGIKPEECQICWHLMVWENFEDLKHVLQSIDYLLLNYQFILAADTGPEHPKYTPPKHTPAEPGQGKTLRNLLPTEDEEIGKYVEASMKSLEEPGNGYVKQD